MSLSARSNQYLDLYRVVAVGLVLLLVSPVFGQAQPETRIVIDDFESYSDGDLPVKWRAQRNGKLVPLTSEFVNEKEWFYVQRERGNGFVRAYADGEAAHINMENGDGFDWDIRTAPILSWDWRATNLPEGAREDSDKLNDSGAGIYVVFAMEGILIKRPKAIKYVYSSTLEEGRVISYGKLRVIVVGSAKDGIGNWKSVRRNVAEDYNMVFGGSPPREPLFVRLWSDSDDTKSVAMVDFDNIVLSSN